MDDRSVFDFSSPEMPRATQKLLARVRLLSIAGLLFGMLAAALFTAA